MNLRQDMDERAQMRTTILNQEQIFRQQRYTSCTGCTAGRGSSDVLHAVQVGSLHVGPAHASVTPHYVRGSRSRLYHVQKQLMQQAHTPAPATRAPAVLDDAKPRRPQLDIWCSETARNPQQRIISFNTARAEDCNLELTLATGPSSSGSCDAGTRRGNKRLKASPNSDSGATAVSSTSTDSELARFGDMDVVATLPVARFHGEVTRRMDEVGQGPWMYRCLSLKAA